MEVLSDAARCPDAPGGTVVTIGTYDGVHLGHRAVLEEVGRLAAERGCLSAVVTFEPHPARIVRPESAPLGLTDLEQKLELLADCGIDRTLVVTFDRGRAEESAGHFVRQTLVDCLHARSVVVGHDFHFGHGREGNVAFLARHGAELGFDVVGLRLTAEAGAAVSSTRIRSLLLDGDVESAAQLLGRLHEVRGVVEQGDGRARHWGFPTANVAVPKDILLPADGVYAGWYVHEDGAETPAAISLGRRPQFYEDRGARLLEPHLLDWSGELYGARARVRFATRLRGQAVFASEQGLVDQIAMDVEATRAALT